MGVKLLFEDGNETPSSILLKHCGYEITYIFRMEAVICLIS
jgi:hypothetical protein